MGDELSADIKGLGAKIEQGEALITNATEVRKGENEVYLGSDMNVSAAIDACERALEALKGSKAALTGDAKLDLVQLGALEERLLGSSKLSKLQQTPTEYGYRSNDIITVIENLRKQFLDAKKDADNMEFEL